MNRLLWLVAVVACAPPGNPAPTSGHATVLLSLDGFRWDYIDRPHAVQLRALAARGVRARRMVPAFPSKTFPNHYTLVTGLYPEHHGIISNTMWDDAIGKTFSLGARGGNSATDLGGAPNALTASSAHASLERGCHGGAGNIPLGCRARS